MGRGILGLLLCAAGCATPYQRDAYSGGYSEVRIDARTFEVTVRGNGHTRRQRVSAMLTYRCAELTQESGFDYFIVVDSGRDAQQQIIETSGSYSGSSTSYGGGTTTSGAYTHGQKYTFTRHSANATIRMFHTDDADRPPSAYQASEVIHYLGATVEQLRE